jgi:hypothetical protein
MLVIVLFKDCDQSDYLQNAVDQDIQTTTTCVCTDVDVVSDGRTQITIVDIITALMEL